MDPGRLNKRVTLQTPTREASTGPVARRTGYADAGTVWAEVRPLTAREVARLGGDAQVGDYVVTIRRPFYTGTPAAEAHPDRDWRITYAEAGSTRALQVQAVIDATWFLPSPHFWALSCTEVRP